MPSCSEVVLEITSNALSFSKALYHESRRKNLGAQKTGIYLMCVTYTANAFAELTLAEFIVGA
jgi:hypothetical protein